MTSARVEQRRPFVGERKYSTSQTDSYHVPVSQNANWRMGVSVDVSEHKGNMKSQLLVWIPVRFFKGAGLLKTATTSIDGSHWDMNSNRDGW
jgi:hypothetical protein